MHQKKECEQWCDALKQETEKSVRITKYASKKFFLKLG